MHSHFVRVHGTVVRGHGVALGCGSGATASGTIARQIPHFHKLGLDLSDYYPATINVSIAPFEFTMRNPSYCFRGVAWTTEHGPEDFSFSPCKLVVRDQTCDALVYYPHPETKPGHFQPPSTIEIMAQYIGGIGQGTEVELLLDDREIHLFRVTAR